MNKDDLIKKAMSELGKRSAKKNKRDYSAMGKKGMEKRWKNKVKSTNAPVSSGRQTTLLKDKQEKPLAH